jgi:hypothetical protein
MAGPEGLGDLPAPGGPPLALVAPPEQAVTSKARAAVAATLAARVIEVPGMRIDPPYSHCHPDRATDGTIWNLW